MKKPDIKDELIKKYVDKLEKDLKAYRSSKTIAKSYLALKNYIEINTELLITLNLNKQNLKDKDDKSIDRIQKFAKEVGEYNNALIEMEKKIAPEDIEDAKKEYGGEYEAMLDEILKNNQIEGK